jgi:3-dehydroquinate dehydratase/shikimate dehydrogenase
MLTAVLAAPDIDQLAAQTVRANRQAKAMEWRLDYLDRLDLGQLERLRARAEIPVIFTLRPADQGGKFEGTKNKRRDMIHRLAALEPDYFDLESELPASFLEDFHSRHQGVRIIRSFHDFSGTPDDLGVLIETMTHAAVSLYKLATFARSTLDALRVVQLVRQLAPSIPIVAHAMGEKGISSRILGAAMGNRLTYAAVSREGPAPGLLSLREMVRTYRTGSLNRQTDIYALLGDPVGPSAGHIYHNKRFETERRNAVYIKLQLTRKELPEFFNIARVLPFRGFSVTMPLKEAVLDFIDQTEAPRTDLYSANTLRLAGGRIEASSTDGPGALDAIEEFGSLANKSVLLIGAGGAAKAIACEAVRRGAKLTIVNRSAGKAIALSKQLNCIGAPLEAVDRWAGRSYDIVVKAVPGPALKKDIEALILERASHPGTRVMDIVYQPRDTRFLQAARARDLTTINGRAMFRRQAALQQDWWFER